MLRNVVTVIVAVVAAAGVFVVRRFLPPEKLRENNEFTGFTYAFAGLVYGVFLAFTTVIVWEHFDAADTEAANEAAHLQELWRDVAVLPDAPAVRDNIRRYLVAVIDHEWPSMAAGKTEDAQTDVVYDELWRRLTSLRIEAGNASQAATYAEALHQLNETGLSRRRRLLSGSANVPTIMWTMLIAGGFGMIAFTYLIAAKHVIVQVLTTGFLAAVLTYSVLIVFALVHPYDGDVRVTPEAFQAVIHTIDHAR
ncbi:MAG: hypothetical protein JWO56_1275 [Acidobacteria bacterium]|nr:hypothetical protein [Acidobacteriota bacterium]